MMSAYMTESRRIVRSRPGRGTGETIYEDEHGQTYQEVSPAEAQNIRQGTAGRVGTLWGDRILP